MSKLKELFRTLFSKLIENPTAPLATIKKLQSIQIPIILPQNISDLLGSEINISERFEPITGSLDRLQEDIKDWKELSEILKVFKEEPKINDLPAGFKEHMPTLIIKQIIQKYLDNFKLADFWGGYGSRTPEGITYWRSENPIYNERILTYCEEIIEEYERNFIKEKVCTICISLQRLIVSPPQNLIVINDNTRLVHISQLRTAIIRKILDDCRSYHIRGGVEYFALHEFKSKQDNRLGFGNGLEVNELTRRFLTALRLTVQGWVAIPLVIEYCNLPWLEPRSYCFNQNLPLAGFCNFETLPETINLLKHYHGILNDGTLQLTVDSTIEKPFTYLIWAIRQFDHMTESLNDSTRASHLFMAIEALYGEKDNSANSWKDLPIKLFRQDTKGYEIIGKVMGEAYKCRLKLFHEGITPPERFFKYHYSFIYNIIIETIKWILENKKQNINSRKDFIEYLRKHRPQFIKCVLTEKIFSYRL